MRIKFYITLFFIIGLFIRGITTEAAPVNIVKIETLSKDDYTRLEFLLEKKSEFSVMPDLEQKRLVVNMPDVDVPLYIERHLEDKRISLVISVTKQEGMTAIISIKKEPFSFHYFMLADPPKLVLDIKERDSKRVTELQTKKEVVGESKQPKENESPPEEKLKVILPSEEEKELYRKGLLLFSKQQPLQAIEAFDLLRENFPESKYLGNIQYLTAESYYALSREESEQKEQYKKKALNFYRIATSKYPKNHRREVSLYRMGKIYAETGKTIEATGTFQILVDEFPKGQYAPQALLARAKVFSDEKRFDEAYEELEKVLFLYPFSPVVRGATYKIADSYYLEKNYFKAVEIYDSALKKWPSYPKANPETLYFMAESYFQIGRLGEAQSRLFELINLYPQWGRSADALSRLGDIYKKNGKFDQSLKLYSSVLRNYEEEKGTDARVRLADMGRKKEGKPKNKNIFDYTSYEKPEEIYDETVKNYPETDAAISSIFGKGKILKDKKQYLKAIKRFEEITVKYPKEELAKKSNEDLKEIFFELFDKYHSQEGFFQALLVYYDNFEEFFKEIQDPATLYKIGDSYKNIGLYGKAKEMFQKILKQEKISDSHEIALLGLGESMLLETNFSEAEVSLRRFLKMYPAGKYSTEARLFLGDVLYKQDKNKESAELYSSFLKEEGRGIKAASAYYKRGVTYEKEKKYLKAADDFKASLREFKALPEDEGLREKTEEIRYKIFNALYKGKKYKEAVLEAKNLQKDFPEDERNKWVKLIEAESYRLLKDKKKSKKMLAELAKIDDELIRQVAMAEVDYMKWQEEHTDLFKKR